MKGNKKKETINLYHMYLSQLDFLKMLTALATKHEKMDTIE